MPSLGVGRGILVHHMMKRTSQSTSYSMGSVGLDGFGALKRWLMVAFILPIARMVVVFRSTEIPFSRCVMKSPSERDFLELAMKSSIGTPPVQAIIVFPSISTFVVFWG